MYVASDDCFMLIRNTNQCIRACPHIPPPDELFNNIVASPALIASVAAILPPAELLAILTTHLVEPEDDLVARSEDPQGSMTKFGEAMILVECVVAHFNVREPPACQRVLSSHNFSCLCRIYSAKPEDLQASEILKRHKSPI